MNAVLQIFLLCCLLIFLGIILRFLSRKQLNLRYTLVWLLADICMIIVTIFPQIVNWAGSLIGIVDAVNTIFLFSGMFMILILLTLTFIVSHLSNKIHSLAQSLALTEKKIRDLTQED